jgi:hypothetical protein
MTTVTPEIETTNTSESLFVQVFMNTAVVKGLSPNTKEGRRRRLADVLNSGDDYIELEAATLTQGERNVELSLMTIEKRELVAAIPWETEEQHRQRLVANLGGRTRTTKVNIVVYAPPYTIEGAAHFTPDISLPRALSASPSLFARFYALTEARIVREDGKAVRSEIVLVNRDLTAAIGRPRSRPKA